MWLEIPAFEKHCHYCYIENRLKGGVKRDSSRSVIGSDFMNHVVCEMIKV